MTDVRDGGTREAREAVPIGRRAVLRGALATAGVLGIGGVGARELVLAQRGAGGAGGARSNSALALARFLNNTAYRDFPPQAIEHAKMILASTFASAAPGSLL